MATKECSHVDSPSTSKKVSFAGSSAVAGKSEMKTQRLIDSFRFFILAPMTVEAETALIDSHKQLSRHRHRQRDNRRKEIVSPNLAADHRRGMNNETPNQDWQILGLGFLHTNRGPFVSPGDSLESRSKSSEASRLHGVIAGGGCIRPYIEDEDTVICHTAHTRTRAHIKHQLTTLMLDAAFITNGYTIWKDAGFSQHERSQCHREAVERSIALHATTEDAGEHISSAREEDKANNTKAIMNMLSNIRFLGRRGIPLRDDGDGNNSNFTHIVHLRTKDKSALSTWLVKKTNKYTSRQMHNKMLTVMTLEVLTDVAASLHSNPLYFIMAYETTY